MTDLLDRPGTTEVDLTAPRSRPTSAADATQMSDRWLLASLVFGAGAIHLAMAPSHLGESVLEGSGFLLSGWAGIAVAIALVVRPRARWPLAATVALSVPLVVVWAISRTAGLPFGAHGGHPEIVGLIDGVAVALEVIATVIALVLLRGSRPIARSTGAALVGILAVLVMTTAALASPSARDHAAHSHGDHAAAGHDHGAAGNDLGFAALSNGHQHEHGSNEALTTAETVALAQELSATTPLIEKYPTLADAVAGGYHRAGPFSPGLGVHYQGPFAMNPDGKMDAADLAAPLLIYDGLEPDSKLAGFMFLAYGTTGEPEGFAGPNDHWHYHEHVCIRTGPDGNIDAPFGADLPGVTEQMCTGVGGTWIDYTGYMVHLWNVPGYESPDGMFTELNPKITCTDGTYYTIPTKDIGSSPSTCRNA